jgi:hypothetical protein
VIGWRGTSGGAAARAVAQRGLGERVTAADVVEHAIKLHPQAAAVRFGYQRVEVAGAAQALVDAEVVEGVVAVGGGAEDGSERDPGRAQLNRVVQPGGDTAQPVLRRPSWGGRG